MMTNDPSSQPSRKDKNKETLGVARCIFKCVRRCVFTSEGPASNWWEIHFIEFSSAPLVTQFPISCKAFGRDEIETIYPPMWRQAFKDHSLIRREG